MNTITTTMRQGDLIYLSRNFGYSKRIDFFVLNKCWILIQVSSHLNISLNSIDKSVEIIKPDIANVV